MKIINLTKRFGVKKVLSDINITIQKGKIYGLVGNNGVGKTTLLRCICGLLKFNSGEIIFDGDGEKTRIGALIETPGLFKDMTAFDNLMLKAKSIGYEHSKQEILELLSFVGLGDIDKKKVGKFSMGMKQRLGIAMALIGNPEVILLDEPTNSLDPQGIMEIRNLILKVNAERGVTIIVSSHALDELSKYATDFLFMKKGKIIKEMKVEELLSQSTNSSIDEYYLSIINE
ncbi:MAG: ATP-binding cassette domain-containing protein [Clostridia bacterium]|nr:ATP-binding cassette domain-containing protein [Clostridia bacterium]